MTLLGAGKVTAGGCTPVLMLDCIATPLLATSTRKLRTAYAGNAMQIQRLSDNATTFIGFSSDVLDTSAVNTFCSATSCRAITWYDQGGNGNDLTIAFATAPEIYNGGLITLYTTRPALAFGGSKTLTNASMACNPVDIRHIYAVTDHGSGAQNVITGSLTVGGYETNWSSSTFLQITKSSTAVLGTSSGAPNTSGSVLEYQYNAATGFGAFWIDNSASGTFTDLRTFTACQFYIGIDPGGNILNDKLGELVIYDAAGFTRITSIPVNEKAYWGTP